MRIHHTLTISALLCCALPASAQIYKCPDANGRTVIQQLPCDGGAKMEVKPASGGASSEAQADAQARLARMKADNQMAQAIRDHVPMTGMTAAQMLEAMGQPDAVNSGLYGGVQKDQHVYYRHDATWYVYTTNGIVDAIQRGAVMPGARPQRDPCPVRYTSLEIRNAEVAASSTTESADLRQQRAAQLAEMRKCLR